MYRFLLVGTLLSIFCCLFLHGRCLFCTEWSAVVPPVVSRSAASTLERQTTRVYVLAPHLLRTNAHADHAEHANSAAACACGLLVCSFRAERRHAHDKKCGASLCSECAPRTGRGRCDTLGRNGACVISSLPSVVCGRSEVATVLGSTQIKRWASRRQSAYLGRGARRQSGTF